MKRGVMARDLLGVLVVIFSASDGSSSTLRRGDRVRDGEWNWEGGRESMGGVGAKDSGRRGVTGAELTSSILISMLS